MIHPTLTIIVISMRKTPIEDDAIETIVTSPEYIKTFSPIGQYIEITQEGQ